MFKKIEKRKPRKPTAERLSNIALHYLGRYAASEASLRRVLENRIRRYAMVDTVFASDDGAKAALAKAIDKIVEKHKALGVINDAAFAEMKVNSLRRAGRSRRRITQSLAQKGIGPSLVSDALTLHEEEHDGDTELKAAQAYAKRRRLGPYRAGGVSDDWSVRTKEIASLARAGFSYDIAQRVLETSLDDLDPFPFD